MTGNTKSVFMSWRNMNSLKCHITDRFVAKPHAAPLPAEASINFPNNIMILTPNPAPLRYTDISSFNP